MERTRVIFKQMYKGLPVHGKNIKVDVTKNGEIVRIKSRYISHSDLNIVPTITAENAAAIVMSDLGIKKLLTVKRTFGDREYKEETVPVVPELIVLMQDGEAHLAWKFYFTQEETMNLWFYGIDAHTGDIISKRDNTVSLTVSGNVDGDIYPTDRFDNTVSRDYMGQRYRCMDIIFILPYGFWMIMIGLMKMVIIHAITAHLIILGISQLLKQLAGIAQYILIMTVILPMFKQVHIGYRFLAPSILT